MLAHHPLITASDRLYFAYGSNLSPEQMARRCPDSIFLGKATLRGHRWQINERGVANLGPVPVPSAGSKEGRRGRSRSGGDDNDEAVVEGLIYAISVADERQLDSYEGVAKGRYDKFEVQVDFEPVRENVFARCTSASVARAVREEERGAGGVAEKRRTRSWAEDEGDDRQRRRREHRPRDAGRRGASVGSSSSSSSASVAASGLKNSILELFGIPSKAGRAPSPSPSPAPRGERDRERVVGGKPVLALVYASTVCVRDGEIKERYVPRMERAMADAVALGVSKRFVEKQMAPRVLGARPAGRSSRRMSLAGGRDSPERGKGRREGEDAKRRSVSQPDGSGRRGRRDSVVPDRHRDY